MASVMYTAGYKTTRGEAIVRDPRGCNAGWKGFDVVICQKANSCGQTWEARSAVITIRINDMNDFRGLK